jgi:hypothetical protein
VSGFDGLLKNGSLNAMQSVEYQRFNGIQH